MFDGEVTPRGEAADRLGAAEERPAAVIPGRRMLAALEGFEEGMADRGVWTEELRRLRLPRLGSLAAEGRFNKLFELGATDLDAPDEAPHAPAFLPTVDVA